MTPERMWVWHDDLPRPGRGGRGGLQRHARIGLAGRPAPEDQRRYGWARQRIVAH